MMKKITLFIELTILLFALNPVATSAQFTLQLLHASDLEGGVEAVAAAPNFAAIVEILEEDYPENTILLSSGDNWITGPFYSASNQVSLRDTLNNAYNGYFGAAAYNNLREAGGRVDISIMNILGFDAACFGNHEFDLGTNAIADIIVADIQSGGTDCRWVGAQFPYLSANLDFSLSNLGSVYTDDILNSTEYAVDLSDPANWPALATQKRIAPSTIITRGGQQIGVVGATTQRLGSISSPGGVAVIGATDDDMNQLATVLQPEIDELDAQGADIIILVSHLQDFALEQQLASLLTKVDIIVAGGSDYLLADDTDMLHPGDVAAGPYPFSTLNADLDSCLIVSTDGQYSYVGRLVVDFDMNGNVLPSTVDAGESGAFATTPDVVSSLWGAGDAFAEGTKGFWVEYLTAAVSEIVIAKDGNTFGYSDVFIDGRRNTVRSQEANMGNLSADANLWVARQHDEEVAVSIKNGGGIRAEMGAVIETSPGVYEYLTTQENPLSGKQEGQISQLDIENTFKFNNGLTILELSAAGLKEIIEHGISGYAPGATPGAFPQVGGLRFSFDPSLDPGSRIVNMGILNENEEVIDSVVVDGMVFGDPTRVIKIVTLDFLAGGGDSYPFDDLASNLVDLNTVGIDEGVATFAEAGSEQDAIAEYIANFHATIEEAFAEAEVEPAEDTRIQILTFRDDSVFVDNTVTGLVVFVEKAEINGYPNPANDRFFVSSASAVQNITIFNLNGQLVRSETVNAINSVEVDLNEVPAGAYLMLVQTNQGINTLRLIKQ